MERAGAAYQTLEKRTHLIDGLNKAGALDLQRLRKGGGEPGGQPRIEEHEDATVAGRSYEPAEGLAQTQAHDHVLIGVAAESGAARALKYRGLGPGHSVEHDEPQALSRHVDTVAHRVGAE